MSLPDTFDLTIDRTETGWEARCGFVPGGWEAPTLSDLLRVIARELDTEGVTADA